MINAEFLRKVSKNGLLSLIFPELTDIYDKILVGLFEKALWNAIDGDYCSHYILEIAPNNVKEIEEILKKLGFEVSKREIWGEINNAMNLFTEIKINWKDRGIK